MTVEDVQRIFRVTDLLILPNGSQVSVDFFANTLFKGAPSDPTYDDLVEIDGGRMGYISFFDQCKEQGILN